MLKKKSYIFSIVSIIYKRSRGTAARVYAITTYINFLFFTIIVTKDKSLEIKSINRKAVFLYFINGKEKDRSI